MDYQSTIPKSNRSARMKTYQNELIQDTIALSDDRFFNHLAHYEPMCYKGYDTPFFLINQKWYHSLTCIILLNILFILIIVFLASGLNTSNDLMNPEDRKKSIFINLGLMALINFTYFLTQFMNPGVRNLSSIQDEEYETDGKKYCIICKGYRTNSMEHCEECGVCVEGLDHHCGFFNKCIAGPQKFAFYGFLVSMFGGFLSILVTLTSNSGI